MTADVISAARARVDRIKAHVGAAREELIEAWRQRDWIASLGINEVIAGKIAPLQDLVPDSAGPAEALIRLGTTLDEVLAS